MHVDMKEVVFTNSFCVETQTKTIDRIADHEIVVKNRYSLISPGTELALFTGSHVGFTDPEITWARYPIKPGYASIGTVVEIGCAVKNHAVGETVFHYGTHADHSIVRESQDLCFTVPVGCDPYKALFTRFGQISYTAVAASLHKSGAVLVLGGGIIGNLCAQLFAISTGRQVIVADLSDKRLMFATSNGLEIVNTSNEDLQVRIGLMTDGKGVETIVEATGVPAMVQMALKVVNEHGEVLLLGSTRGKVELDVYKLIHRKFSTLSGVHENRYPKFGEGDSQYAFGSKVIEGLMQNTLRVDGFITDHIRPDQIGQAYHWLLDDKDNHLGIVIHWEEKE
jgi:2-desacetyl-2-hydroxyethyl bacteriochlorophyllide A dehydrogenase